MKKSESSDIMGGLLLEVLNADTWGTETTQETSQPEQQEDPVNTYIAVGLGRLWIPDLKPYGAVDVRRYILSEICEHEGDLFILDDLFSGMMDEAFNEELISQIQRLQRSGYRVARYWACEGQPEPDSDWKGVAMDDEAIVFPDIVTATQHIASSVRPGLISVGGCWLGHSRDTGQINSITGFLSDLGHENIRIGYRAFTDPGW